MGGSRRLGEQKPPNFSSSEDHLSMISYVRSRYDQYMYFSINNYHFVALHSEDLKHRNAMTVSR